MRPLIAPDPTDDRRVPRLAELPRLAWVLRSHRWSPDRLRRFHEHQLARVLDHARDNSSLWAERLPPGASPDRVPLAAFSELPTIDKTALIDAGRDAFTHAPGDPGHRATISSSGTTGEVLEMWVAASTAQWIGTHTRAARRARGIPVLARSTWVRANRTATGPDNLGSARSAREMAEEVARRRPAVLGGLPHLLLELGEELRSRHRPRWLIVGGDTTSPETRERLRAIYGVDPFDSYGSIEVGAIAWQCRARDLYHLHHTLAFVEVVDGDGIPVDPGDTGDVVVTGLAHPATPVIRYRQGDRATLADRPCRCGSPLPAFASLDGRNHSWFVTPQGRVAPQRLYVGGVLEDSSMIRRYRLQQDETGTVRLECVTNGGPLPRAVREQLLAGYRDLLPGVPMVIDEVDQISLSPAGKLGQLHSSATAASFAGPGRASRGDDLGSAG